MPNIDVSQENCGRNLVNQLGGVGAGGGMVEGGVKGFDVIVSPVVLSGIGRASGDES